MTIYSLGQSPKKLASIDEIACKTKQEIGKMGLTLVEPSFNNFWAKFGSYSPLESSLKLLECGMDALCYEV